MLSPALAAKFPQFGEIAPVATTIAREGPDGDGHDPPSWPTRPDSVAKRRIIWATSSSSSAPKRRRTPEVIHAAATDSEICRESRRKLAIDRISTNVEPRQRPTRATSQTACPQASLDAMLRLAKIT